METSFTPVASLSGGVLIGLAAVALMALHGRIMGATGILAGVYSQTNRPSNRPQHVDKSEFNRISMHWQVTLICFLLF